MLTDTTHIWDLLVKSGGANESERQDFLQTCASTKEVEYRFRGYFGFGGKIRSEDRGGAMHWRMDYYTEHQTVDRDWLQCFINFKLGLVANGEVFDPTYYHDHNLGSVPAGIKLLWDTATKETR